MGGTHPAEGPGRVVSVRNPTPAGHTGMKEARISYLCTRTARGRISLDEWSELLGYIALDPVTWKLILIAAMLVEMIRRILKSLNTYLFQVIIENHGHLSIS